MDAGLDTARASGQLHGRSDGRYLYRNTTRHSQYTAINLKCYIHFAAAKCEL